nr:hypothetical protein [uncultured Carboxylicivirga sp.]
MRTIKMYLVLGALCVLGLTAKAQDSKFMLGAGLDYATEIDNLGIHLKGLYLINDAWEADAGYTYYFKKNYTNWSSLDFNGHYVFTSSDKGVLYALAGLNVTFYKMELGDLMGDYTSGYDDYYNDYYGDEYSDLIGGMASLTSDMESKGSEVGVNIGLGGRMGLSDNLFLSGEIKYTLGGADYLNIGAGLMYCF